MNFGKYTHPSNHHSDQGIEFLFVAPESSPVAPLGIPPSLPPANT